MTALPDDIKQTKSLKLSGDLLCVADVPGTSRVYVGGTDAKIYNVDFSDGDLFQDGAAAPPVLEGHSSYVSGLAVIGGDRLVSCGWDKQLIWWDVATGQSARALRAHEKWIRHVAATPDGKIVATVADDMLCRLWDAKTGRLLHELRGHEPKTPHHFNSKLFTCAVSSDGRYLATGDRVGRIVIWEIGTGKQAAALDAPLFYNFDVKGNLHSAGGVRALAFSPDGRLLVAGGIENTDVAIVRGNALIQVFDWKKGERTHEFKDEAFVFESLAFHHEAKWLLGAAGASKDKRKLLFYDLDGSKLLKTTPAPTPIFGVALTERSGTVYGAGRERLVRWDL